MGLVAYYSDPLFAAHDAGADHPERPDRVAAADRAAAGCRGLLRPDCPPAPMEALLRVHDQRYLTAVRDLCERGGGALDPDTAVNGASFEATMRVSGATLDAVARARREEVGAAFVAGRPPGHHAGAAEAMGFCIVNHVAVAAAALVEDGAKVAVVDWDAHHGNGTQDMFWGEPSVLYTSIHQYPFYPGTGHFAEVGGGDAVGTVMNVPMPAGAGPAEYDDAWHRAVLPRVEAFAPDLVLVSCGFDAHAADPLCLLRLESWYYGSMARDLMGLGAPVVAVLEGGYDLSAITESTTAVLTAMAAGDAERHDPVGEPHPRVVELVDAVLEVHSAAGPSR